MTKTANLLDLLDGCPEVGWVESAVCKALGIAHADLGRVIVTVPAQVDAPAPDPAPAGWGFPGTSRKAHYFPADSLDALCGKWGFFMGHRTPDNGEPSIDDCVACRRKLDATNG